MILLRFNYDDIKNCKSVDDVFRMFGIGINEKDKDCEVHLRDEKVFGPLGYYRNMFMNDETYNAILEVMNGVPNYKGRKNPKNRLSYAATAWVNYSPMSSGPRFEKVKELAGGEINRSVIYIITPDDDLYEMSPVVGAK